MIFLKKISENSVKMDNKDHKQNHEKRQRSQSPSRNKSHSESRSQGPGCEKTAANYISKKTFICIICQDETDHPSSKCPNIVCKECGEKGHSKKHCPKNRVCSECNQNGHTKDECTKKRLQIIDKKRKGCIKKFNKILGHGVILDKEGDMWTFISDREFEVGDKIVFDWEDNHPKNVMKLKDAVCTKRPIDELTKNAEEISTKYPKMSLKFKSVCILDLHVIKVNGNEDHLIQIGAFFMDQENTTTFLRPIVPNTELTDKQLKMLNLKKYSDDIAVDTFALITSKNKEIPCCSEQEGLINLLEKIETFDNLAIYATDLEIIMPILMGKLKTYDLVGRFARSVMWLCDLKSIVRAKDDLKHFKSHKSIFFEH